MHSHNSLYRARAVLPQFLNKIILFNHISPYFITEKYYNPAIKILNRNMLIGNRSKGCTKLLFKINPETILAIYVKTFLKPRSYFYTYVRMYT